MIFMDLPHITIPFLGTYFSLQRKTFIHSKICSQIFRAPPFTVVQNREELKCPSMVNKLWSTHITEYHSPVIENFERNSTGWISKALCKMEKRHTETPSYVLFHLQEILEKARTISPGAAVRTGRTVISFSLSLLPQSLAFLTSIVSGNSASPAVSELLLKETQCFFEGRLVQEFQWSLPPGDRGHFLHSAPPVNLNTFQQLVF